MRSLIRLGTVWLALVMLVFAQRPSRTHRPRPRPPQVQTQSEPEPAKSQPGPVATKPDQPAQAQPEAAEPQTEQVKPQAEQAKAQGEQPAQPATAPSELAPSTAKTGTGGFVLNLQNASLTEVIEILAKRLKINYILDPRVKGSVNLNTYGELKEVDARALLDIILRMNGAALIQVGGLYRVVPLAEAARQPLSPQVDPKVFPENEQVSLNLVFLKYANAGELSALLEKFLGEGATMITYAPANLLLLLDNNRNMRRTMELISLFDSDELASQRVRLLEVKNGRPSDISKELETVLRSASLGEKGGAVKFLPIDRINLIIAVAPNPGVFDEVEKWLRKLDVPIKVTAGSVENYVYRVKYGRAETLGGAIMQLYFGLYGFGYGGGGYGGYGGYGGGGSGGYGGYDYGGGGSYGGGYGAYSQMGGPRMGYGMSRYGYPGGGFPYRAPSPVPSAPGQAGEGTASMQQGAVTTGSHFDMSGSYLGSGYGYGFGGAMEGMPRVVPNPLDNSLLIQATPQDYQQILKLLKEVDVPPRQVLIEAKIYEVNLTGAFAAGVQAYLQKRGSGDNSLTTNLLQGSSAAGGVSLTAGMLVGQTRELLGFLTAQEDTRRAKVISAPSVIATDSIPASINVGTEVPTLTSQAITGAQIGGTNLFTNTVQNRTSGVTMNILAHVNPSGIVTLEINQEVSAPVAPSANASIQSPSFSKRTVQTQVTVQDGDTIAIGGIIQESETRSTAGVPVLNRIPILGAAFGSQSTSKERTELIVFMTPRVIYDANQMVDASEELKSKLKKLQKIVKE